VQEVLATAISHSPRLEGVCERVHELVQIASDGNAKSVSLLEFSRQSSQLMVVSDSLRAQLENALRSQSVADRFPDV
ncbi:MAG TPA: hypothetical protein PLV25_06540, partial [Opitutales bacterium]|nr:hypothetical protein [Opitutales bacterium]